MKKILVFLAAVSLLSTSSWAFNGVRKGFVLGGGLGFSPAAKWSVDDYYMGMQLDTSETKAGVGLNLLVGYAWDEHNMIVYEGNVAGYKSDFFSDFPLDPRDRTATQGFNGAAWYHYYGPTGRSFFTAVGLGFYYFKVEDFEENDAGGALLLGAGYEFTRHLQFGVYLSGGRTSSDGVDFEHGHISVLMSAIAF